MVGFFVVLTQWKQLKSLCSRFYWAIVQVQDVDFLPLVTQTGLGL